MPRSNADEHADVQRPPSTSRTGVGLEYGDGSYLYSDDREMSDAPPDASGVSGQITEYAFNFPRDQRYLAAKLTRPEGDVYASVYVATETFDHFPGTKDHALVLLDVIETVPMETGMVSVNAATMAEEIAAAGHVALYINFDFDNADIRPESQPIIDEIVKLMKDDPSLNLTIEGHTDDVGTPTYNKQLSEARAISVVAALTEQGIESGRLKAVGYELEKPIADNSTDEGRARNRRVELVKTGVS